MHVIVDPVADPGAPVADAGEDRAVDEGTTVQLSGSGTDPDGNGLEYSWVQTGGPAVVLSDPTAPNPTFEAPEGLSDADITFELTVTESGTSRTEQIEALGPDLSLAARRDQWYERDRLARR